MADINLQDIIDQANAKARQQQLMAMGFGILGARTGNPWTALGQGGLIGMQAGSQARQDYLKQALEQFQLQKQANFMNLAQQYMAEDQAGQTPPSTQIAPQMQLSPNTPLTGAEAGAAGVPNPSLIGGVPLTPMIPQGTPPSQVQGYTPPNWRQEVPAAAKGFGLMSQDPTKLITDLIKWGSETKIGPDGTVTTMTGRPIYKQTDAGVQLYTPQGTPGAFLEYSPANTQAAAQRNAAIEGAKAKAVEEAKAEQDLVSVNVGRQTQQMSRADALRRLGAGGAGGWQPGQPLPEVPAGSTIRTTADGIPYMAPPSASQATVPTPGSVRDILGQLGLSADPLATKGAEEAIITGEQAKRAGASAMVQNSQNMYEDVRKGYMASRDLGSHVANMRKLDSEGLFSGPPQLAWSKFANTWNSAFPSNQISGERLANTQTFNSEVSKMQQAIARTFPGQQSDRELIALTASLPTLMMTPQGRSQVYETLDRKIQDATSMYRSASKYYKENNGNLIGWEPPPFTPPGASYGTTGGTSQFSAQQLADEARRRGLFK